MTTQIPDLGYTPVPDIFKLPAGVNFGPCSGVAVNAKNNVLVFNRSDNALMEFTHTGDYVRTMGRGVFTNPHGLRIDREGNIWCTDTMAHIVVKMNADGRILMVMGVAGRPGDADLGLELVDDRGRRRPLARCDPALRSAGRRGLAPPGRLSAAPPARPAPRTRRSAG